MPRLRLELGRTGPAYLQPQRYGAAAVPVTLPLAMMIGVFMSEAVLLNRFIELVHGCTAGLA